MTTELLRFSLSPYSVIRNINKTHRLRTPLASPSRIGPTPGRAVTLEMKPRFITFKALESDGAAGSWGKRSVNESSVRLDVSRTMCGGCMSRVKSILSPDERVDPVVVNMLTDTAAVRYYVGSNIFPDVLMNDVAGPNGNSLLLS